MRMPKRNVVLAAGLLLALFAATTAVTLTQEHDERTADFVPQPVVCAVNLLADAWNGSQAQALYCRWDGHVADFCANPSHRH
ncbi:hypothetical protein LzC2_17440 [Planctomycetes bacterium LzC2]|uniref:Secreted protein n=2 Tax=Alienimonas chondri TaxID=2681879 RepID=A0ABX1VE27_9PLAN|nr:hypothetical protein [Alienimonas chondri]